MAKTFSRKAFREWLDILAKVCVKTRDNFTCQIQRPEDHTGACAGRMQPLDYNCQWCHIISRNSYNWRWSLLNALCGCGHCHNWAHANPVPFGIWFAEKYPIRNVLLNIPLRNVTWRKSDFEDMERRLVEMAIILNVDILHIPDKGNTHYQSRFEIRKAKYTALKEKI